jgi:aspartate aminotransferase
MVTPATSFYKDGKIRNQVRIAYVLEVPQLEKAMEILAAGLLAYPGRTA